MEKKKKVDCGLDSHLYNYFHLAGYPSNFSPVASPFRSLEHDAGESVIKYNKLPRLS